jgi:hypothetical protein
MINYIEVPSELEDIINKVLSGMLIKHVKFAIL